MNTARVIFPDAEAAEDVIADLVVTPAIEGGAGPVKLGICATLPDGRPVMAHPFTEAEAHWILAYAERRGLIVEVSAEEG